MAATLGDLSPRQSLHAQCKGALVAFAGLDDTRLNYHATHSRAVLLFPVGGVEQPPALGIRAEARTEHLVADPHHERLQRRNRARWRLPDRCHSLPVRVEDVNSRVILFSLAEVWGLRPDGFNPCRHVKRYKENKRERFLSPEETERLGEVLRKAELEMPSAITAFRLLLLTGCRLSEIQFLRWEFVKDDCIDLPDAKTGSRIVPLGPEARAVLAALPRADGNPRVICGKLPGTYLTDLQRPWQRIRARADLEDLRIHDLRHRYASRALALGENLTMSGKLLGHTQVQTTARYAHLARDSIQNAAARITGSIGGDLSPDQVDGETATYQRQKGRRSVLRNMR